QGIVCGTDCTIVGNQCRSNGGTGMAGIWVQNGQNRIEGKDVTFNGFGIYVSSAGKLIIRNTVGNSNQSKFYIKPGNHVGTIVQPTTNAALINGNTGGGLGTTDPNANFVY